MRVFSDLGLRWSRRSTLAFAAFAVIVVAFTALALSWNGLSAFRNSANADPALGPFFVGLPGTPTPTPAPTPSSSSGKHPSAVTPSPTLSPHPSATHPPKVKHTVRAKHPSKPKVTHTPKPKPTHTPKAKTLYVHTPKFVRLPHKPQYPPAAPTVVTHYGVLAGAAGQNYTPR